MNNLLPMLVTVVLSMTCGTTRQALAQDAPKIRVLIVTGGHAFDRDEFFKIFNDNEQIVWQEAVHPEAEKLLTPEATIQYDVILFYDLPLTSAEADRANFVNLLKKGIGVVFLHHSLGGYNDWDAYEKIVGGRFFMHDTERNGKTIPASVWKDDVHYRVQIADKKHPVTKGVDDFDVEDETYGKFEVLPSSRPLLTTNEPTAGKTIGWYHTYGKSRIVYIMLGHGPTAYNNPNYRKLVANAIQWTAHRKPAKRSKQ